METRLENLESRQKELLAQVSTDDFVAWKASSATKALQLQFMIDLYDIQDNWSSGRYAEPQNISKAQGQAEYLLGINDLIRGLKTDD